MLRFAPPYKVTAVFDEATGKWSAQPPFTGKTHPQFKVWNNRYWYALKKAKKEMAAAKSEESH